eukprot:2138861-Rhodomonas_salina.1
MPGTNQTALALNVFDFGCAHLLWQCRAHPRRRSPADNSSASTLHLTGRQTRGEIKPESQRAPCNLYGTCAQTDRQTHRDSRAVGQGQRQTETATATATETGTETERASERESERCVVVEERRAGRGVGG